MVRVVGKDATLGGGGELKQRAVWMAVQIQ